MLKYLKSFTLITLLCSFFLLSTTPAHAGHRGGRGSVSLKLSDQGRLHLAMMLYGITFVTLVYNSLPHYEPPILLEEELLKAEKLKDDPIKLAEVISRIPIANAKLSEVCEASKTDLWHNPALRKALLQRLQSMSPSLSELFECAKEPLFHDKEGQRLLISHMDGAVNNKDGAYYGSDVHNPAWDNEDATDKLIEGILGKSHTLHMILSLAEETFWENKNVRIALVEAIQGANTSFSDILSASHSVLLNERGALRAIADKLSSLNLSLDELAGVANNKELIQHTLIMLAVQEAFRSAPGRISDIAEFQNNFWSNGGDETNGDILHEKIHALHANLEDFEKIHDLPVFKHPSRIRTELLKRLMNLGNQELSCITETSLWHDPEIQQEVMRYIDTHAYDIIKMSGNKECPNAFKDFKLHAYAAR